MKESEKRRKLRSIRQKTARKNEERKVNFAKKKKRCASLRVHDKLLNMKRFPLS